MQLQSTSNRRASPHSQAGTQTQAPKATNARSCPSTKAVGTQEFAQEGHFICGGLFVHISNRLEHLGLEEFTQLCVSSPFPAQPRAVTPHCSRNYSGD